MARQAPVSRTGAAGHNDQESLPGFFRSKWLNSAPAPPSATSGTRTELPAAAIGGKGFVLAISRHWPEPEAAYRRWARSGQKFGLGMVQLRARRRELGPG
jgi:hypothetical protein